jgi:hypothetical protein
VSHQVFVEAPGLLSEDPESVDDLIAGLNHEGLDAMRPREASSFVIEKKISSETVVGGALPESLLPVIGSLLPTTVLIWLAAQTASAVINQVVSNVVDWMKESRRDRRKSVQTRIILYEGDQIRAIGVIDALSLSSLSRVMFDPDVKPAEFEPEVKWHSAATDTDRWRQFERYTQIKPPKA